MIIKNMVTKICCRCKEEEEINLFQKDRTRKDGHYVICKSCLKEHRVKNKEKISEKSKDYYEKTKVIRHEKILENNRRWRKNNPSYTTDRKKIDINFKLIKNVKSRFKRFLNINNVTKKNKTLEILGCNPQELKKIIENQFLDGMNWDNYGLYGWHIDHIIPLSSANTEEEIYKLAHYTNLQPLWAKDNLAKSNKLPYL